eukprot:4534413-Pleurochrysis_carterae.AAC.1
MHASVPQTAFADKKRRDGCDGQAVASRRQDTPKPLARREWRGVGSLACRFVLSTHEHTPQSGSAAPGGS